MEIPIIIEGNVFGKKGLPISLKPGAAELGVAPTEFESVFAA